MRKRQNSIEEEGSEMEVDHDEEKMDVENDDEEVSVTSSQEEANEDKDEEEDDAVVTASAGVQNPFMDAFYGLSSEDPRERVQAGQTILHCCLLDETANSKDAAYAFRRLLNGLCSGRAAARQGNASALANFLKIAFRLNIIDEIREQGKDVVDPTASQLEFVRQRLLEATDPSQITGKKSGSEERDYHFGRLFGILSVIRSGVLVRSGKGDEDAISDSLTVSTSLAKDIAELFWLKKWMREPAAHAIVTLLKIFYDRKDDDACRKIVDSLVNDVIAPNLLKKEYDHYEAEQIGIALFIQSIDDSERLPSPMDEPLFSIESISNLAPALGGTSNVVHPRMHFVWDAIWCYLTEPISEDETVSGGQANQRKLRSTCLLGNDSPTDLLDALIKKVVMQQLLRLDVEEAAESTGGKATDERKSLGVCIVRNLLGVPFASSLTGQTQVFLDEDSIENVLLLPPVLHSLFVDVPRLLKPLSVSVLESLVDSARSDPENDRSRRLCLVRSLLQCNVRFDEKTRTSTVASLLNCDTNSGVIVIAEGMGGSCIEIWGDYLTLLESKFFSSIVDSDDSATAKGILTLLYNHAKNIIRVEGEADSDRTALKTFKETTVRRILSLFMASAFFDCSSLEVSVNAPKKKKTKKNSKNLERPVLEYGSKLKDAMEDGRVVDREIRSFVSMFFFSLTANFVHAQTHPSKSSSEKVDRDVLTLSILADLCDDWKSIEKHGAVRYVGSSNWGTGDENDEETADPDKIIKGLMSQSDRLSKSYDEDLASMQEVRCSRGIAILAYTLYLHRLTSDSPEDVAENDDPDNDEEDDEEEICSALEGLESVLSDFVETDNAKEENPLLGLAEICANILSSPLGSGNIGRGSSPKLIREAVEFAWKGGLGLSASQAPNERTLFDSNVAATLLTSIGAPVDEGSGGDGSDNESDTDGSESDEDEDDDDNSDASNDNVFGKASGLLEGRDDMHVDAAENESDVEIDPSMVKSMLEEDSDASVNAEELEHHEGADAALAKLIALKQASRKAGQQAREKIEISHQLRCSFLFEILFSRNSAWGELFRNDSLLGMVMPLLRHRKKLEKGLEKMSESNAKNGVGDKRGLLDRLTHVISLMCKVKPSTDIKTQDIARHSESVKSIMDEAKHGGTKEQMECCKMSLVFVLRSVASVPDMVKVASSIGETVPDWTTKKTVELGFSLFDYLIRHMARYVYSLFLYHVSSDRPFSYARFSSDTACRK